MLTEGGWMRVKGKRVIRNDNASEFYQTLRGQYIISQALVIASKELKKLEERHDPYPKYGQHAEPSNRKDMEYLIDAYPLYMIHNEETWNIEKGEPTNEPDQTDNITKSTD